MIVRMRKKLRFRARGEKLIQELISGRYDSGLRLAVGPGAGELSLAWNACPIFVDAHIRRPPKPRSLWPQVPL